MKLVTNPKVYLIGETKINTSELDDYLYDIGAYEWNTDATSDSEKLCEVYGRICYKSFKPGLNPNVTKIREGNKDYIGNILKSNHTSVLEHAYLNFIFTDVSRVLIMELLRHRVGTSISQESGRYCRLEGLTVYLPSCFNEDDEEKFQFFCDKMNEFESIQKELADMFNVNDMKDFTEKKEVTSAFRRLAPEGLCQTIGWGTNFRNLRHVISLRTSIHAEEEIRKLFNIVYFKVKNKYPNMFQDFVEENTNDGIFYIHN